MLQRLVSATALALCLSVGSAHSLPVYVWHSRHVKPDDQWIERMTLDPFGNVVAVGNFYTLLQLSPSQSYTALGGQDGFVAKFDTYANVLWSHQLADALGDRAADVAVDPVGNVIAVGWLSGVVNDSDAFVAKYAPDGTFRWLKRFGTGDGKSQLTMAVSTNLSKEIIIAGEFEGSIDLGGGVLTETGGRTLFMAKLGQLGEHIWSKKFTTTTPFAYNISDLATGADGRTVMAGVIKGTLNLGTGDKTTVGGDDIFLARFDALGNALWVNQYGDAQDQFPTSVSLNESGQIAMCGSAAGTVNFGGGALVSGGSVDPCLAVFTPLGAHVWSKIFTSANVQYGMGATWASNQDVLVSARGVGTLDMGGGALAIAGPGVGVWLGRYFGANGVHRWSRTFTGTGVDLQVVEEDGIMYLGGSVRGTVDFGGGASSGETDYIDIVLAKYGDALTGVSVPPIRGRLEQNIPNPFNPRTTIPYTLDAAGDVTIGVYDTSGRVVTMLRAGARPAGSHTMSWDGRDRDGTMVSSGVYFYRLEGVPGATRKMVLLK